MLWLRSTQSGPQSLGEAEGYLDTNQRHISDIERGKREVAARGFIIEEWIRHVLGWVGQCPKLAGSPWALEAYRLAIVSP